MDSEVTPKMMDAWKFCAQYSEKHGYGPTLKELGAALGITSPASQGQRVNALIKAGLVSRASGPRQRIEIHFLPVSEAGRTLAEALREAGPDGQVKLDGHTYGVGGRFTSAEVLTCGWEVVKEEATA